MFKNYLLKCLTGTAVLRYNISRGEYYTTNSHSRKKNAMDFSKKVCPKCGVEKPLTPEFWNRKGEGFQVYCIPCKRKINLERYHKLSKEAPIEDPSQIRICTNCKVGKPLTKEHWTSNGYGWSSHCKSCSRQHINAYRVSVRLQVLKHYSKGTPKCSCCGTEVVTFLNIDHVNGDGAQHRKEVGGRELAAWLVKNNFPEGFRVLCSNCNNAFYQLGYCPHHPPT